MPTSEQVVLDVGRLRMWYGTNDVLHDVTFQARHGEVLALLGPNGAGKTTTVEILEGFRTRSAGHAAFDPQARREFHDLVRGLASRQQTTILLTTHDLDEAEKLADRIIILNGGRIIADGTPSELARRIAGEDDRRTARPAPHGAPRVRIAGRRASRQGPATGGVSGVRPVVACAAPAGRAR